MGIDEVSSLARIFSQTVVSELAVRTMSPLLGRLLRQSTALSYLGPDTTVGQMFQEAFGLLETSAKRPDYVYRAAVINKCFLNRHTLNTTTALTEFRVGFCKADVVILNGKAQVFEIKSERDTLNRLMSQVSAYREVFGDVNVIASSSHVDEIEKLLPSDVGIHLLTRKNAISTIRKSHNDPSRTSSSSIFEVLRTNECCMILRSMGYQIPDVPNTELRAAIRNQFVGLTSVEAHSGMLDILKKTRSLSSRSSFLNKLPRSIRPLLVGGSIKPYHQSHIVSALLTPLSVARNWA